MKLEDKRNEDPKLKTKRFLPDKSSINEGKLLELLSNALIFEPLVLWLLGNRINNMKTREGKVLRVLPSGRWVPQNKKIMDGTYLSRIGDARQIPKT